MAVIKPWVIGAAILAGCATFAAVRACQPVPATHRDFRAVASDRIVTVTPAGKPASANAPVIARLAVSAGRGVITVAGNHQPVIVRQQTPAVRVIRQALSGKRHTISETAPGPMETATVAGGSDGAAIVVTSQPEPVDVVIKEPEPSRFGLIGGYLPGMVAVDVAVLRWRVLGVGVSLDLMASPLAAGAGVAVGDKVFGTAGCAVTWSGSVSPYVAGGVRF